MLEERTVVGRRIRVAFPPFVRSFVVGRRLRVPFPPSALLLRPRELQSQLIERPAPIRLSVDDERSLDGCSAALSLGLSWVIRRSGDPIRLGHCPGVAISAQRLAHCLPHRLGITGANCLVQEEPVVPIAWGRLNDERSKSTKVAVGGLALVGVTVDYKCEDEPSVVDVTALVGWRP